jgi:hypothetical protein
MQRDRLPYLLIPFAAFLATLPLLIHGCSCGHDLDFHLLSWMEAARQFTHGNLHPQWAYSPAWNAGEPRFVFYPPLSWTIGAILGLILPWMWTPIVYTWLALTASGFALHRLARDFTNPTAALIASVVYTVNPYMLFTAHERTAYAELLAAAWIPLLLHAILRRQITIPRIAIPIALLWLTNAPAAVMSCYALALLAAVRLLTQNSDATTDPGAPYLDSEMWASRESATAPAHSKTTTTTTQTPLQRALNTITGTILGLGVAAFYIIPAAYERRYVQIAMAIIPFYRIQDNFLFHRTGDLPHDQVLRSASSIALILIAATAVVLLVLSTKARVPHPSQSHREGWDEQTSPRRALLVPLTILTTAITLLLTPLTNFIWTHAPELSFLQFPWRLLAILAAVFALALSLALAHLKLTPTYKTVLTIVIATTLSYPAYSLFHQTCEVEDTPQARLAVFNSNQGTDPTDEYTPTTADNDSLAQTNARYWLSTNPNARASLAHSAPAPLHLNLRAPVDEYLILNLRDYPNWHITRNGSLVVPHTQRDDGLITIPIPSGSSSIDITYVRSLDQKVGSLVSLISVAVLLLSTRRSKPFAQ